MPKGCPYITVILHLLIHIPFNSLLNSHHTPTFFYSGKNEHDYVPVKGRKSSTIESPSNTIRTRFHLSTSLKQTEEAPGKFSGENLDSNLSTNTYEIWCLLFNIFWPLFLHLEKEYNTLCHFFLLFFVSVGWDNVCENLLEVVYRSEIFLFL